MIAEIEWTLRTTPKTLTVAQWEQSPTMNKQQQSSNFKTESSKSHWVRGHIIQLKSFLKNYSDRIVVS